MIHKLNYLIHSAALTWLVALFVTIASIWLLSPLAIRLRLIDEPGGRKHHKGSIPLIGGIAMFFGFCFALLTLNISLAPYRSFLAGSIILVLIGFLDDLHELSTRSRFVAQIIAAAIMTIWGGNIIFSFGNLLYFGDIHLGLLAIPVTIFAVVAVINAVNMTDGVDGLAGSIAFVELLLLILLALHIGDMRAVVILTTTIFAVLGFLVFNFPFPGRSHAKIFMGDSGSMFIGFVLVWFLVSLSQGGDAAARPVTMLWIMAFPLFDATWLLLKRTCQRRSPLAPGRDHLHHLLQSLGLNSRQITLVISSITLLFGLVGIISEVFKVTEGTMFVSFIALFAVYSLSRVIILRRSNI